MNRDNIRLKKKISIRKKIFGDTTRPRVSVFKSLKYIYVQAIDDINRVTLCSYSSLIKTVKETTDKKSKINVEIAKTVGEKFGEELKSKGIEKIVFDRNGYKYHGRVKSLADGIRSAGINF